MLLRHETGRLGNIDGRTSLLGERRKAWTSPLLYYRLSRRLFSVQVRAVRSSNQSTPLFNDKMTSGHQAQGVSSRHSIAAVDRNHRRAQASVRESDRHGACPLRSLSPLDTFRRSSSPTMRSTWLNPPRPTPFIPFIPTLVASLSLVPPTSFAHSANVSSSAFKK